MSGKKLIIEARINEYTGRDANPKVPWTAEEIGRTADAVREAGASIVHFHARTADGSPEVGYEAVREAVQRIRAGSDILIHPTLGVNVQSRDPEERLAPVLRLAEEGLRPDFAPMDMGTSNTSAVAEGGAGFLNEEGVYLNTTGTLAYFAERLREARVKPSLQIWNLSFLTAAETFHRLGLLDSPLWMCFVTGGPRQLSSHPATAAGLRAYLDNADAAVPAEWSVLASGADLLALAPLVIEEGGHLAIGLGDYAYPELGQPGNEEVVARVAELARRAGREIASPDEAREMLGLAPAGAG